MEIRGALLALPVAATVMMLIDELRVELPGQQERRLDAAKLELRQGSRQLRLAEFALVACALAAAFFASLSVAFGFC